MPGLNDNSLSFTRNMKGEKTTSEIRCFIDATGRMMLFIADLKLKDTHDIRFDVSLLL